MKDVLAFLLFCAFCVGIFVWGRATEKTFVVQAEDGTTLHCTANLGRTYCNPESE